MYNKYLLATYFNCWGKHKLNKHELSVHADIVI